MATLLLITTSCAAVGTIPNDHLVAVLQLLAPAPAGFHVLVWLKEVMLSKEKAAKTITYRKYAPSFYIF